jgi:hypothetical protein
MLFQYCWHGTISEKSQISFRGLFVEKGISFIKIKERDRMLSLLRQVAAPALVPKIKKSSIRDLQGFRSFELWI